MPEYIGTGEIVLVSITRFWPSWLGIAVTLAVCWPIRDRLGVFGRLYGSKIGVTGLVIVLFWVFTAIFADVIAVMGPLDQSFSPGMKKGLPGVTDTESGVVFLWGGDNLARDVFSRVVHGSSIVLVIAPAATLIAYMVGSTLGLPAGYFRGWSDTISSFLANLILAFPVILLFYLLVTPEVRTARLVDLGLFTIPWSIPIGMAAVFFLFPIIFLCTMWFTKYENNKPKLAAYLAVTLVLGLWAYSGLVFASDPLGILTMESNELNVFAAVILGSSPGVFRIVRGLTMDIMTRDYVAADRRFLPAHRIHHDPARNAGLLRPRVATRKRRLGLDDQPRPALRAAVQHGASGAVPGAGADEPGAGPEPARGRSPRGIAQGLRRPP
jgi:peptide/nickel transport system permease protein